MSAIIFDCEIKHGVITDNNQEQLGYAYCNGWQDFSGMGVSVIGAYEVDTQATRVFCADNAADWLALTARAQHIVSFNGNRFDIPLLEAHDLGFDPDKSIDLAALIWAAAGVLDDAHPKDLSLDAICKVNGIPGKTGSGADAPQNWQDGKIGRVIDYCLGDVRATAKLYELIVLDGWIYDPRTMEMLHVRLPR